jgi:hypothetical protein
MVTKKKATKKKKTTAKKPAAKKAAKVDLEPRLAALRPEEAELNPDEPVAQTIAGYVRAVALAKPALPQLSKLPGFQNVWVTEAMPVVEALTAAEAAWANARARSRAGISPGRVKEAEKLKSDIVASGRYLLRQDAVAQQQLDQVMEGTGVADLAADLAILADVVAKNAQVFALDRSLAKDAAAKASIFSAELGKGIDPADAAGLQARRNRLFWLAKKSLSELRAALKFHWRKEPTRLAQLGDSYASQLRRHARRAKKTTDQATT